MARRGTWHCVIPRLPIQAPPTHPHIPYQHPPSIQPTTATTTMSSTQNYIIKFKKGVSDSDVEKFYNEIGQQGESDEYSVDGYQGPRPL